MVICIQHFQSCSSMQNQRIWQRRSLCRKIILSPSLKNAEHLVVTINLLLSNNFFPKYHISGHQCMRRPWISISLMPRDAVNEINTSPLSFCHRRWIKMLSPTKFFLTMVETTGARVFWLNNTCPAQSFQHLLLYFRFWFHWAAGPLFPLWSAIERNILPCTHSNSFIHSFIWWIFWYPNQFNWSLIG